MLTSPVKTLSLTQADSSWPAQLNSRLGITAPACLWAIGNAEILATHKLGLFCSARCPTDRTLAIYDGMRKLRDEGVTVISGFHSPVEKECLSILLGGRQPIVICLARAMNRIRLPKDWRDPLEAGEFYCFHGSKNRAEPTRTSRAGATSLWRLYPTKSFSSTPNQAALLTAFRIGLTVGASRELS